MLSEHSLDSLYDLEIGQTTRSAGGLGATDRTGDQPTSPVLFERIARAALDGT